MDWFNCIKIFMPYRELGCWGLSFNPMWARNSFVNTLCQVGEEGTSHMDAISPHINSKNFRIKDSLLIVSGAEQFDASSFSLRSQHYAFYFHSISFSSLDLVAVQACEVELELYYLECPFFFSDLVTVHQSPQATQLLFQVFFFGVPFIFLGEQSFIFGVLTVLIFCGLTISFLDWG